MAIAREAKETEATERMRDVWFIDGRPQNELLPVIEALCSRRFTDMPSLPRRNSRRQRTIPSWPPAPWPKSELGLNRGRSALAGWQFHGRRLEFEPVRLDEHGISVHQAANQTG
jgi:hypothetical protein